jgi:DNA-3-methyladenine glycosylase I
LRKREGYRRAFAAFDPKLVARFTPARVGKLMLDPSIVPHRGKIESAVTNARAFLAVQKEFGSFDAYLWKFVDGRPLVHRASAGEGLPAESELSTRISKDLKERGFKFVGSTIVYAYLQAMGVVDDHYAYCFRAKKKRVAEPHPKAAKLF